MLFFGPGIRQNLTNKVYKIPNKEINKQTK
jgi:hypothetical protein